MPLTHQNHPRLFVVGILGKLALRIPNPFLEYDWGFQSHPQSRILGVIPFLGDTWILRVKILDKAWVPLQEKHGIIPSKPCLGWVYVSSQEGIFSTGMFGCRKSWWARCQSLVNFCAGCILDLINHQLQEHNSPDQTGERNLPSREESNALDFSRWGDTYGRRSWWPYQL